ncbi:MULTISPECIES: NAD(P)H-binding protein [Acinetobacter]|uniref:NAD(P)H-binding protein n=1 Tax=Acinetobacter TaxID=469 RepID=UPI000EA004B1|nr:MULTISPECIES: NAD(P)H-binding protein [Acinetobacter]RKG43465.1 NAD-dependent epimerase/dehydratase family protein [Acinetobacter cumulans]RZG59359.1 NAD-dependent epimerase/dehydratase family protein [Acinetobacter sp. WCHAc060006]
MHILFIGYGKTSQRATKLLFEQGHQITTISQSPKTDEYANHLIQDVHHLNLSGIAPIDAVYVLLSPNASTVEAYQQTYVDTVQSIVQALKGHPIQRIVVVSSTRVYGENAGERVDDETLPNPIDAQGRLLLEMEQLYQTAFPAQCVIIRPSGIYSGASARMQKLAETTKSYPNIHWSNRIHIDDLARFLVFMLHVEHAEKSYICTNNMPQPLHEKILNIQRELNLPELVLESDRVTGKQIYADRMKSAGFQLEYEDS